VGKITPGQQFEVLDQSLHGRVVSVLLPQLDRQAFGEAAGENARRIKALEGGEHALGLCEARAQPLARLDDIGLQITAVVELVDEILRDQPVGHVRQDEGDLLGEMIPQRHLAGDEIVEIVIGTLAAARHRFPLADEFRRIEALRGTVIRKDIGVIGVEFVVQPAGAGTAAIVIPVAGERLGAVVVAVVGAGILGLMSISIIFGFAARLIIIVVWKFE